MNREELLRMADSTFATCMETLKKKNHDYSGGGGPFDNFSASEIFGIPKEKGILLRIMDKMMRIKTYLDKGELKVVNESVLDAIDDNINYLILLRGMIVSKPKIAPLRSNPGRDERSKVAMFPTCQYCWWWGRDTDNCDTCLPTDSSATKYMPNPPPTKGEHHG